jgi:hypothetical protein
MEAQHPDPLSVEAVNMCVSLMGSEAGNLALRVLATCGVYVADGMAQRTLPGRAEHQRRFLSTSRLPQPEIQITQVLVGQRRSGDSRIGQIHALVLSERALLDASDHGVAFDVAEREAQQPVVEKDRLARVYIARQVGIGAVHLIGRAQQVARGDTCVRPSTSCTGPPPASRPMRNLGPDRSCITATGRGLAYRHTACGVFLAQTMREIQVHDVDAGSNEAEVCSSESIASEQGTSRLIQINCCWRGSENFRQTPLRRRRSGPPSDQHGRHRHAPGHLRRSAAGGLGDPVLVAEAGQAPTIR